MTIRRAFFPNLICFFFVLALPAFAQSTSIQGRIADLRGASIVNAKVTLRHPTSGFERTTMTNASGEYQFSELPPNEYSLSALSDGFSLVTRVIQVSTGVLTVDFTLRPGSLVENVSVIATEIASTYEEQQRIPGSVEVINQQTLELSRPFNFNEALRKATGVYTRDEEGFGLRPSIGLRGLDPNRSAKILLLEDGVPLGHAPYGDSDAYYHPPIERYSSIEILKGSSQIAYGPNTLGGVINYVTPNPPDKLHGSLTLLGGNRSFLNGYGNVGFTAGRTGLLFDFMRKQGTGSRENIRSGLNDFTFKSVTRLNEVGTQTLSFKFNYYGENSNVSYSGLTQAEYDANPRFNPFRNDFFYGDRFGGAALYTNALSSKVVFTTAVYAANFNRDWWRQSSNSDQRPNRKGKGGCNGLTELNTLCGNEGRLRNYDTFGIDPRLKISSRTWGETDFGFRFHAETQNRIQLNNDTLGPGGRGGLTAEDNQRKNRAVSGYIQHRFLFGNFTITPGLRVEHVNIERTNRLGAPLTGKTDVTQWIPGLGLSYTIKNNTTFFAGVHRGFSPPRPADIISSTGGVLELDSELSWNYEVGVRSLPVEGLRFDAAFFRLDYQNQIVPANLSGGVGAVLTSAGETLHQGFEFSGRVDSGTILNSRHNFYARVAHTWVKDSSYRGVRFSNVSGFGNVPITGNRLSYAPEHLLTTTLGYSHPGGFDAVVESIYTAQQFADDLNTIAPSINGQRGLIPAYNYWNASANYRLGKFERLQPTVFVAVKNLANDTVIIDRRRGVLPGIPRLLQVGVKFSF